MSLFCLAFSSIIDAKRNDCDCSRRRRSLVPDTVAQQIAWSIAGSRLDYCNSLLVNRSNRNLDKLQRVQDNLARVVCSSNRSASAGTEPAAVARASAMARYKCIDWLIDAAPLDERSPDGVSAPPVSTISRLFLWMRSPTDGPWSLCVDELSHIRVGHHRLPLRQPVVATIHHIKVERPGR